MYYLVRIADADTWDDSKGRGDWTSALENGVDELGAVVQHVFAQKHQPTVYVAPAEARGLCSPLPLGPHSIDEVPQLVRAAMEGSSELVEAGRHVQFVGSGINVMISDFAINLRVVRPVAGLRAFAHEHGLIATRHASGWNLSLDFSSADTWRGRMELRRQLLAYLGGRDYDGTIEVAAPLFRTKNSGIRGQLIWMSGFLTARTTVRRLNRRSQTVYSADGRRTSIGLAPTLIAVEVCFSLPSELSETDLPGIERWMSQPESVLKSTIRVTVDESVAALPGIDANPEYWPGRRANIRFVGVMNSKRGWELYFEHVPGAEGYFFVRCTL